MKDIFKIFLIALFVFVAVPVASVAAEADQDQTIQVDQLEVESTTTIELTESSSIVVDVGKSGITSASEDDHQVFRADFQQYEQIQKFARKSGSTHKGHANRINSPPLKIIN